jgi:hypothetical protein
MTKTEETQPASLSRVGDAEYRGRFVYVERGYGFIIEDLPGGRTQRHFLRSRTLKEARKATLDIKDLDGRVVWFKLRESANPRHAGKPEACQVRIMSDNFALA